MTTWRLALIGPPNTGKSTLFNGLTGGRAKVANYPGVTVETRSGLFTSPGGREVELVDLPGVYGMSARSMDERVALDAIVGRLAGEAPPHALIVLIDAAQLRTHLYSVLQLRALGRPMVLALNMIDLAERDGMSIDIPALEERLGVPVAATRATRRAGRASLLERLDEALARLPAQDAAVIEPDAGDLRGVQRDARAIADAVIIKEPAMNRVTRAVDRVVLHPLAGPVILAAILFFIFQAVYAWSGPLMDAMDAAAVALGNSVAAAIPDGWLRSLLVDGVIAGVGSVVIFLPQIVILFALILALEASGYMARAAFLMDELMMRAGLNGRAFIPLLSGFACAIPAMMAARSIESERDRLTTILVTPLMACSARLPVYALIIAAFIPPDHVGPFNLQGLVLFALYVVGVISAVTVAFVLRRTVMRGASQPLIMELPTYKLPELKDYLIGVWSRAAVFLRRAGTIIFVTSIILWFLVSYPASENGVRGSFAGMIGSVIEPLVRPIGFNLELAISLVPGMAAREVVVNALAVIYAVEGGEENTLGLADRLQAGWTLPTALAVLAWYVFAPQCISTLAVARRETNSWAWTGLMFGYLLALAYVAAGATYWVARWAGF